jgi:hypothetical protein
MPKKPSGAVNVATPLKTNGDIDWDAIKPYVTDIVKRQNAPNTVRGILYILETKQILKKTDYSYNRLDSLLVDWRKSGHIDWTAIADGSGRGVVNDFADYVEPSYWVAAKIDTLQNAGKEYRAWLEQDWRWQEQPDYVEFLTEKHTVTASIVAHIEDLYVRVTFNRGDSGWRFMHDNCQRWKQELRNGKKVHIWYLGDNDTKGRDMDRQIMVQLAHFNLWGNPRFEFKRIAVLLKHVSEYHIPKNKDKKGGDSYEIDGLNALNERAFKELLRSHVKPYFDEDIYKKMMKRKVHTQNHVQSLVNDRVHFEAETKPSVWPHRYCYLAILDRYATASAVEDEVLSKSRSACAETNSANDILYMLVLSSFL